ncbi:MAG: hypothetical protein AUJ97_03560 [Bacteroidetes bacterium CG2_30_32_10]|nr:MAG: hypothetical protein AUJ97_03560 [Bacteroidetes bacterium CG2_30_32_10]
MKKIILSVGLMMLVIFAVKAQNPTTPPVNPNAPEIKFESLVHDYGTIVQDANGDCEFKFTNVGKEPLILTSITSSCGCTTPYWSKEPILPNKTEIIKVHYATNRVGVISKQVTVISNAKNSPVVLSIKGNVLAKPINNVPENPTNPNGTTPVVPNK